METAKGSTRLVHIYEDYVIKYPRGLDLIKKDIEMVAFMVDLVNTFKGPTQDPLEKTRRLVGEAKTYLYREVSSPSRFVAGLNANATELILGDVSEIREFLVPTRDSVPGVMNIQDRAATFTLPEGMSVKGVLARDPEITDLMFKLRLNHTLKITANFGFHEGQVKLLDYGEPHLLYFLLKYHEEVRAALDEIAQYALPVNENPTS